MCAMTHEIGMSHGIHVNAVCGKTPSCMRQDSPIHIRITWGLIAIHLCAKSPSCIRPVDVLSYTWRRLHMCAMTHYYLSVRRVNVLSYTWQRRVHALFVSVMSTTRHSHVAQIDSNESWHTCEVSVMYTTRLRNSHSHDKTWWYVRRDAFTCVKDAWLMSHVKYHIMTYMLYTRPGHAVRGPRCRGRTIAFMRDMTHFIYVPWHIHMCHVTDS